MSSNVRATFDHLTSAYKVIKMLNMVNNESNSEVAYYCGDKLKRPTVPDKVI